MPTWRFWNRKKQGVAGANEGDHLTPAGHARTALVGTLPMPPEEPVRPLTERERMERIERLRRRRASFDFDLAQAELATQPENPWQDRIALLNEALATVTADQERLKGLPPEPSFPLPPTPITQIVATSGDPADVDFQIGDEHFSFREAVDWDERGGAVVRGQLRQRAGNVTTLLPPDLPQTLREPLTRHLQTSLNQFATDLRDRALAGEPMPQQPTLTDLAKPCPDVGGWRDWLSRCTVMQERAWQRQQLDGEYRRLMDERAKEAEEQHRWAERLPVIHRRLLEIDREIAALGG